MKIEHSGETDPYYYKNKGTLTYILVVHMLQHAQFSIGSLSMDVGLEGPR